MSEPAIDQQASLEFFRAGILEPAIRQVRPRRSIVAAFGVVEAAHLAALGSQIGYFDPKQALQRISSVKEISEAWNALRGLGIVSPEEKWSRIFVPSSEEASLSPEPFFETSEVATEDRELAQGIFQNFLLLTSEAFFEGSETGSFLRLIGWLSNERWEEEVKRGIHKAEWFTLGFANVLGYLEAMVSCANSAYDQAGGRGEGSGQAREVAPGRGLLRGGETADAGDRHGERVLAVMNFTDSAREVVTRRLNLQNTNVEDRYFWLAGELARYAEKSTSSWQDLSADTFQHLELLIWYAGGSGSRSARNREIFMTGASESPMDQVEKPSEQYGEYFRERPAAEPETEET